MGRLLRQGLLVAFLAVGVMGAMPARAVEPILSFIFYMAREIMYEGFQNNQNPLPRPIETLPAVYPGTMVEPSTLRALIDESFIYLSERRRRLLFESFHDELVKPKNAAVRASMITYFAEHAYAVRTMMDRLSKLNETEMREVSERFAAQAGQLSEEDREKLRTVIREGLLPVPPDLNKHLVLAISDLPDPPADAATVGKETAPGKAKPSPEAVPSTQPVPRSDVAPLGKTAPTVHAQTAAAPGFTK